MLEVDSIFRYAITRFCTMAKAHKSSMSPPRSVSRCKLSIEFVSYTELTD
jgi:hypothetical protein